MEGNIQHLCITAPKAALLTDGDLKESHSSSLNVDVKISKHVVRKLFNFFPFWVLTQLKKKKEEVLQVSVEGILGKEV